MRGTLLLCLLTTLQAAAQATADSSAAQSAGPAADPARPTVTNPAHIPPPGYLQFEQGFLQAASSPGVSNQFSIVQTTKLSLNHYVMVQVASQPFAFTTNQPTFHSKDTGDLILGAQVLFDDKNEGRSRIPTIALAYNGRIRSGSSPDLDIGSFSQGLVLLASGTLYGVHYDTNYTVNSQPDDSSHHRAQYGQSLSLTRQITQPFSLTGELWHFTQPLVPTDRHNAPVPRANAVGLLVTPAYALRPTLVLDCGFDHGLTSTSTAWEGFAGFTYLLPHRLWSFGRR